MNIGNIAAVLSNDESTLVISEELIMLVIREDRAGKQTFTRWVDNESNWLVDDLNLWMRPIISKTVHNLKLASGELKENVCKECTMDVELFEAVSVFWIFSILALKKVKKTLHCETVSK